MINTQQCIEEIGQQFQRHRVDPFTGRQFAVLKPISDYEDVDFKIVAIFFNTNEIHSYGMLNKIVIEA